MDLLAEIAGERIQLPELSQLLFWTFVESSLRDSLRSIYKIALLRAQETT